MVTCAECDNQSAMFCANCGKPICQAHTVHGRYCCQECYTLHSHLKGEDTDSHKEQRASRNYNILVLAAAGIVAVVFITLYLLQVGGF